MADASRLRSWLTTTGEALDVSTPVLTVAGLRPKPGHMAGQARARWEALEPAWRLLHAVTLLNRCMKRARARTSRATRRHGAAF